MVESDNIDRSYAAIGRVCAHWSDIKWYVQHISELAAPFFAVDYEREDVGLVFTVALAHMDIRNKVATAKILLTQERIGYPLRTEATTLLNNIDNVLRLERNRFVHDEWLVGDKLAARTTLRPKLVREQARKMKLLLANTRMFSAADLEAFGGTLRTTLLSLNSVCRRLEGEFSAIAPQLRSSRLTPDPTPD